MLARSSKTGWLVGHRSWIALTVTLAAAAAISATTLAACGADSTKRAPSPAPTTRTVLSGPTPAPAPPTLTPSSSPSNNGASAGCEQVPPHIVDIINAAFTEDAHLSSPQAVNAPTGLIYVGGNIDDSSGNRVSNDDVWLVQNGAVFALSGDARRRTSLPDGRDYASAGDEYGAAAQECVPNNRS